MAFTVKTAYYDAGWQASTESAAVDYRCRWLMNSPCEAQAILNDAAFASLQKYTVTSGNVYYGKWSYLLIEDPTNTEIFRGPIVKVQGSRDGTVTLFARDWLHQLEREGIDYDTRLDLGSGLRESHFHVMQDDTTYPGQHVDYHIGAHSDTWFWDDDGGWANDAFNNDYLVFNYAQMAGTGTFWLPAMAQTETTGTFTNDYWDTFYLDASYYKIVSAAAGGDVDVSVTTYCYVPEAKVTQIDVDMAFCTGNDSGGGGVMSVKMYDYNDADLTPKALIFHGFGKGHDFDTGVETTINPTSYHFTDVAKICSSDAETITTQDLIGANGEITINFDMDVDVGELSQLHIYYVRFTIHYEDVSPITAAYAVKDTVGGAGPYIVLNGDKTGLGIDKHAKYCITKPLTYWVADLVTSYDDQQTINCVNDLTASTNYVGRHYRLTSPLDILRDFGDIDGTEFWLDTAFDLHWNSAYNVAGAPNITDASVLYWRTPTVTVDDLGNAVTVVGSSHSDGILEATSTDAGSQTDFGVYDYNTHERDIHHQTNAQILADALKERLHDGRLQLGYAENGFTSRVLGEVLEIDSTHLNLTDAYYIVTELQYRASEGVSYILLTPRSTSGLNITLSLAEVFPKLRRDLHHALRSASSEARHTEVWS